MSATEKVVVGCYLQLDKQPRQNGKTLPCTRLMDERDRLKDENEKLREQIHWLKKGDILHVLTDLELEEQQKHEREMQASIKALDDENKQLHELVLDMLRWMPCHGPCSRCERYKYPIGCEFERRWLELGIEVDE